MSDIKHTVVAAASSSSADRARKFLEDCKCPSDAAAYGSYEELVNDKNVDIIYVATPHSHHYQNTMLCLEAGKNVLCEKSFTVNAAQTKKLIETAKAKKLFLMEALWTRYFPLSKQIRKYIEDGKLGAVHRVIADLSFGQDVENAWGTEHRMVNMELAGGALLDRTSPRSTSTHSSRDDPLTSTLVGIYPITWCFQTLYHTVPAASRKPPNVASSVSKYAKTGADENTSIILTFPSGPGGDGSHQAHGIALTSFRVATDVDGHNTAKPAIRIHGTKGEIQVDGPAYRPTHYRIIHKNEPTSRANSHEENSEDKRPNVEEHECEIPGHGMFWEADECGRCLRDGKLQSDGMTHEESLVIMDTMDQVRKQNGLVYPEKIETTEYPVEL